ncbi:group III truncated hemoglobin [Croceicoccus ponticola]|uniref:Group III truncated hemoglobin n=1 Tax=Croceicoccus ponticola TaxID=2217664 RepID=A0A437GUT7_9SPHN|nr:group III truncated hemoglobin [Croceicoccus ponticola]RVQ64994.1 group III truncated hemoglobin [Croceicoccus ponticola]
MKTEQIDDQSLRRLVEAFYARVRTDDELGPIFNDAISGWPEHLDKLTDFWSSVMLTTGRYKGQPVPAHMKHRTRITPELFERWLSLWTETTDTMMEPTAAKSLQDKARRIAQSLQLAMFFRIEAECTTSNRAEAEKAAAQ